MSVNLQLRSTVTEAGNLELSLVEKEIPTPGPDEVIVKVEATPINPSDQGLLLGQADMTKATSTGSGKDKVLSAPIPEGIMKRMAFRVGQSMIVGNEGAGEVVAAGDSEAAQALMGKTVAGLGGGMYTQYRKLHVAACLELNEGTTAREGASCFVNPLTSIGMVETMKLDGHSAIVHTAAASNLGQMLNKLCQADGVPLVNIVRKADQADLLKSQGAKYVVNSSDDDFMAQLTDAIAETGATIAFDAIGGGRTADAILNAMEAALNQKEGSAGGYGSTTLKQLYIYGGLDVGPTTLTRGYGMQWSIGGFLLTYFLQRVGMERAAELRQRVADEIKTTFASNYTKEISLEEALDADVAKAYWAKSTGDKYLINPQL